MNDSSLKPCQLCTFVAPSLKDLLKHIRQVHSHRPGFRITCHLGGCKRTFTTFEVFRNHVYGFHTEQEAITLERQEDTGEECGQFDSIPGCFETLNPVFDSNSRKKAAAMWILKVQEKFLLPQSTMELILKDVTGFFQDLLSDLVDDVNAALCDASVDHRSVPGLSELFCPSSLYANPFTGLETQYKQLKYCKETLGFVVGLYSRFKQSYAFN